MRSVGALLVVMSIFVAVAFGVSEPLGGVIHELHPPLLNTVQSVVQRQISAWLWDHVVVPVLTTPGWAALAALGLVTILVPSLLERRRG